MFSMYFFIIIHPNWCSKRCARMRHKKQPPGEKKAVTLKTNNADRLDELYFFVDYFFCYQIFGTQTRMFDFQATKSSCANSCVTEIISVCQ